MRSMPCKLVVPVFVFLCRPPSNTLWARWKCNKDVKCVLEDGITSYSSGQPRGRNPLLPPRRMLVGVHVLPTVHSAVLTIHGAYGEYTPSSSYSDFSSYVMITKLIVCTSAGNWSVHEIFSPSKLPTEVTSYAPLRSVWPLPFSPCFSTTFIHKAPRLSL
jgi:hypothetical protein